MFCPDVLKCFMGLCKKAMLDVLLVCLICSLFYAQILVDMNSIVVMFLFFGHKSSPRRRMLTKMGQNLCTDLPDLSKPSNLTKNL